MKDLSVLYSCFSRCFQLCHALFDPCVVDPQELIGAGSHVNIEGLPLAAFLVQELVHCLVNRAVLEIDCHEYRCIYQD